MNMIISDANILIDMEEGGVLLDMFRLAETFAVPDILFLEELVDQHPELPGFGLVIKSLGEDAVIYAYDLRGQYGRPSQMDLFALALAHQENCPLMTGDKNLREAAELEGIEVCGTLWLVERLIVEGLLTIAGAEKAYEKMKLAGRRLPWDQVRSQLKRLAKSYK